jgi:peptidoglycan/LPS O-acetylase OafA/YrhL
VTASLPDEHRHVRALDGLRGIAALVVVLRHTFNKISMPAPLREQILTSPLAPLLSSQGAVQLFFVLSGWVLAASLQRSGERAPWPLFYVRRVFRIHPPYVFAVLVAWAASTTWSVPDDAAVAQQFERLTNVDFGIEKLPWALSFPGRAPGLLPVAWSLRIEMIYSFALPLILIAARPGRGLPLLAASAALLAQPSQTLWYAFDFALGVVAFREREAIARALRFLRAPGRGLLLVAGTLMLSFPVAFGNRFFGPPEIAVTAGGSAALIAVALHGGGFARALAWRPFVFLGTISYSLYLLHRIVIMSVAPHVLEKQVIASKLITVTAATPESAALLFALVIGISILASMASYRWIERPAIAVGNRLCTALASRRRRSLAAREEAAG